MLHATEIGVVARFLTPFPVLIPADSEGKLFKRLGFM
jgi:hypothetical protein